MSIESELTQFSDFLIESLPSQLNISNKDISSTYISMNYEFIDDVEAGIFLKAEENLTIFKNSLFEEDIDLETSYSTFTYIKNTSEIKLTIDQCEDYTPPTNSETVLIPPVIPSPVVPRVTEYIFSGMDPVTKLFKIWTSSDINSKKPTESTVDYLHVGIIDTFKKAI